MDQNLCVTAGTPGAIYESATETDGNKRELRRDGLGQIEMNGILKVGPK